MSHTSETPNLTMAATSKRGLLFLSVFVFYFVGSIHAEEYSTKVYSGILTKHYLGAEKTNFRGPSVFNNDITTTATASASFKSAGKYPSFSTLADELNYIRTIAGTGIKGFSGDGSNATKAQLSSPVDVAVDRAGNVYIADATNHRIRKLTLSTGIITTVAGTGGTVYNGDNIDATAAAINNPEGVSVDGAGNIYIADTENNRIRKVTVSTGKISTVAGTGLQGFVVDGIDAREANLQRPSSVAVDAEGNIYIADTRNHRIRKVSSSSGMISTVAGTGTAGFTGDGVLATTATLFNPLALATDIDGNFYIADTLNHCIRKVTVSTGIITTITGTGVRGFTGENADAKTARLRDPKGVSVDRAGNIFIADSNNYRVRKVIISTGKIVTVAGTGVKGFLGDGVNATSAELNYVAGIVVDAANNLYIADTDNHRVRSLTGPTRTSSPTPAPMMDTIPVPSMDATSAPSFAPSFAPSMESMPPSFAPSIEFNPATSFAPTTEPTEAPSVESSPTPKPSFAPNTVFTPKPTLTFSDPTPSPSYAPTKEPTPSPTYAPTKGPTPAPSVTSSPTPQPTLTPVTPVAPSCPKPPTKAPRCRPIKKTRKPTHARKSKKKTCEPTM